MSDSELETQQETRDDNELELNSDIEMSTQQVEEEQSPPSSPPTTTKKREENWKMIEDYYILEAVLEFGCGRWNDVRDRVQQKHIGHKVRDSKKYQKRYNDIMKKGGKYAKTYARKAFKPKAGLTKEQKAKKEEEHAKEQQYKEEMFNKIKGLIVQVREKENLATTEHKRKVDEIGKEMVEKGEKRKEQKVEKFQVLKEEAEDEKKTRKAMVEICEKNVAYLEKSIEADRRASEMTMAVMELLGDYLRSKMRRQIHNEDVD